MKFDRIEREKILNEKWETLKKLWKDCDSYEEFAIKADVSGIDDWTLRFWFWYFNLTVNHPILFNKTEVPLSAILFVIDFFFFVFIPAIFTKSSWDSFGKFFCCSVLLFFPFLVSLLINLPQIFQKYRKLEEISFEPQKAYRFANTVNRISIAVKGKIGF